MVEILHMWTFQKQIGEQADFYDKIVLFPTGLKVRVTSRVVARTQTDFYDKIVQPCCSQ